MGTHYWIRGDRRAARDAARATLDTPEPLAVLDAHRRLGGPYTAAGTLLRGLLPEATRLRPDLGRRHNIAIVTCAAELRHVVPNPWKTLEWSVGHGERTRFYSRLHTLNIANALAELLRDHLADLGAEPRSLVFENLHHADPTDQELVAVLLRRTDLARLTVVACTGEEAPADPPGEFAVSLAAQLDRHAVVVTAPPGGDTEGEGGDPTEAARAFVDGDCVSDDPSVLAAYAAVPAATRARMHDERAAALAASDDFGVLLGAVPFHREHGSDPAGGGADALRFAMEHCRNTGLYHASTEAALRGREIVDRDTQHRQWWRFTNEAATSMATLGRAEESEALYEEARATSIDPMEHLSLAYGTAMLHARHHREEDRDYDRARGWMNLVIAVGSMLPDPKERAFQSAFGRNGLALVEVRQKRPDAALRLLEEGMAILRRELEPTEHELHRSVLRYNRAQVYGMTGRLQEALDDYTAVVERDPDYPQHHFNRGNVLRRLGRTEDAIAEYEQSLLLSPPFPEAHHNLGDSLLDLDDTEAALRHFSYAIELDPEFLDSRINRAALLCALEDADGAWRDVEAGLALAPDNAHLLSLKGRLLAERDDRDDAAAVLTEALTKDPQLAEAWALRGGLAYENGDLVAALRDLDQAIELTDKPEFRFNRAVVHEDAGHLSQAIADYDAVIRETDDEDATSRRDHCRAALGDVVRA